MKNIVNKILEALDNITCISNCLRFMRIHDSREQKRDFRTIFINNLKPSDYAITEEPLKYCSNAIKTSKYTLWNFIPKNLFEQFRRIANFYFLVNLIIIFIIPNPPTSPYANMIPILFVIVVTAIKQGYEDILRHLSDNEINKTPVRILRNGKFHDHKWEDIVCGDIVEVLSDQAFPCDLLLLHSRTENNQCYITTANLDGETNLKIRSVPTNFPPLDDEQGIKDFRGVIVCDKPNLRLYDFKGKCIINNEQIPITNDNILLRGCCLRVSPLVYGCVIYTGKDTKMMKNSKFKSNKLSCIERRLNTFIIVFLVILALLTFGCFGASFAYIDIYKTAWYLTGVEPQFYYSWRDLYNFINLILYMNLFNYIVPLSMYVTIELQRFVGSQFIEWDLEMYDPVTDQPAKANTSDLNEDLGQVEYLFSDKTGTLTENEMEFKQFAIEGVMYEERNGELYKVGSDQPTDFRTDDKIIKLIQVLCLCHTVQIDETANEKYQASSPDEFSFIKFCCKLGIIYEGDEKDGKTSKMIRTINFKNTKLKYELLQVLEFDSTRKRMSVVVRDLQSNKIILFCKGAESSVLPKCVTGSVETCDADIKKFGEFGWRTLVLTYKVLNENEYKIVEQTLKNAYNDIMNRDEMLSEAYNEIESRLELLGASGIEDKLQDDVANTLEVLRSAGIKVWVLTGDKRETAINISYSCKHFSHDMIKFNMTDLSKAEDIKDRLDQCFHQAVSKYNEVYALIIDGFTLGHLFSSGLQEPFRDLCMRCSAVLCCRMTPAQKAEVVRLIKKSKNRPMTAAIGDGANDVSMIQEAHVGLGIFGKEGRNAARSADFAFAKFKFAKRILLIHGYLYYTRASNLNFAFAICQFYYAFFNAFTVTSLYDSVVLTVYNVTLTAFPILLFGLFEQKRSMKFLDKNPYLYRTIKGNEILRTIQFIKWNLLSCWHSLCSFFFAYALIEPSVPLKDNGTMGGSFQFGAFVITTTLFVVHLKLLIEWQHKNPCLLLGFLLSILSYVVFCLLANAIIIPTFLTSITDSQSLYWVYFELLSSASVWLCIILTVVTALIPDLVMKAIENMQDIELIRRQKQDEYFRSTKGQQIESETLSEKNKDGVRVFYVPANENKISNTKVSKEKLSRRKNKVSGIDNNNFVLDEVNK